MTKRYYSYCLVFGQFLLIFLIALNSNIKYLELLSSAFVLVGILLGLWSIVVMRKSKLRVTPDVAIGSKLITNGPYKYIRHPMYSSVLLVCFGMVINKINMLSIIFYLTLIIILSLKMKYEEKSLLKSFDNYNEYIKKSKKLIPFIY